MYPVVVLDAYMAQGIGCGSVTACSDKGKAYRKVNKAAVAKGLQNAL